MQKKKPTMTREEALELYADLQKSMAQILKNNPPGAKPPKGAAPKAPAPRPEQPIVEQVQKVRSQLHTGPRKFIRSTGALLGVLAFVRLCLVGLELSVASTVEPAQAVQVTRSSSPQYSKEELALLKQLDGRRVELEDRRKKLDEREEEMNRKEKEFAVRLNQLRDLTAKLKASREEEDKQQDAQLAQLANVYGSMNPPEAAALIEQLDSTIALALLRKMPEKRLGQILALMNPEKALLMTRMLTGK